MGLFFKDKLTDVGKYAGSYGNQKAYTVKSNKNDETIKIHCEKTGPYKLSDDEYRQVLEHVRMNPNIVNQYKLASHGGFPITEDATGHTIYIYFFRKTGMFGLGGTHIYAKPTHARKIK